ncbi:hypothetical protein K661_02644 [Piscirickettsia salmonis LF-89 = ATCC VR-1361]|nr:hypothetical protein K661_02644 [Piscirickettsia salmonis LF-89 = ATCC VR-1361]
MNNMSPLSSININKNKKFLKFTRPPSSEVQHYSILSRHQIL